MIFCPFIAIQLSLSIESLISSFNLIIFVSKGNILILFVLCRLQANACHNKWLIYWTDRIYWLLYLGGEIVFLYLLYYSED